MLCRKTAKIEYILQTPHTKIFGIVFFIMFVGNWKNNTTFASHTIAELEKIWKNLLHTYKKQFLN